VVYICTFNCCATCDAARLGLGAVQRVAIAPELSAHFNILVVLDLNVQCVLCKLVTGAVVDARFLPVLVPVASQVRDWKKMYKQV
jgi:hypothetical protein